MVAVHRPLEQLELPADQVVVVPIRVLHHRVAAVLEQQARVIMVVVELTEPEEVQAEEEVQVPQVRVLSQPLIQMVLPAVLVY